MKVLSFNIGGPEAAHEKAGETLESAVAHANRSDIAALLGDSIENIDAGELQKVGEYRDSIKDSLSQAVESSKEDERVFVARRLLNDILALEKSEKSLAEKQAA